MKKAYQTAFSEFPLEHPGMDILRSLSKIKESSQFEVVIKDRYSRLTKAKPTSMTNDTKISRIFLEHRAANYRIPFKLSSDNSPQFVSKLFVLVFKPLGVDNITTSKYSPYTNGKLEPLNSTDITQLLLFASEHHTD